MTHQRRKSRMRYGLPRTRFKRGLRFFAAGEARRDEAARMASARSLDTPSFASMLFDTALNPGCFFAIGVSHEAHAAAGLEATMPRRRKGVNGQLIYQ
jgi:hypothetical protein